MVVLLNSRIVMRSKSTYSMCIVFCGREALDRRYCKFTYSMEYYKDRGPGSVRGVGSIPLITVV